MKRLIGIALLGVGFIVACGSRDRSFDDGAQPPGGPQGGGGNHDFGETDAASDARPMPIGTLTGKVVMPEGTIPLSDALIYLSPKMPDPIPRGVYCDKCVQLDSYAFT